MESSFGRITARLLESTEDRQRELVHLINKNINPPDSVKESDVYIRAMYIVSNEVNSFGGRFPEDELYKLVELLIDSPVMVGHRKDKLPIGRTFHAEIVNHQGTIWVKSYFYWLRSAQGCQHLKENIDGGIYKECSIGFTFSFPECSICHKDIRTCVHQPLDEYTVGNKKEKCYYNYRKIGRVLETSLVYRGAVPHTSVSKELKISKKVKSNINTAIQDIKDLKELNPNTEYLVIPFYEAVEVLVDRQGDNFSLTDLQGNKINDKITGQFKYDVLPNMHQVYGQLVGYRGKERCSVTQLKKYLVQQNGMVTRLELKLLPENIIDFNQLSLPDNIKILRHQKSDCDNLFIYIQRLMTKKGVRLWESSQLPPKSGGYHFYSLNDGDLKGSYTLFIEHDHKEALLNIKYQKEINRYRIKQFHLNRLQKGGRFITDQITSNDFTLPVNNSRKVEGAIKQYEKFSDGLLLECDGAIKGRFVLQSIKLNSQKRFLFYQLVGSV